MSATVLTFLGWGILMILVVIAFVFMAKRSKAVEDKTEDIASQALPQIGEIAEKKHEEAFGRAPTNFPRRRGSSWYPPKKKTRPPD